jgi:hypothetical protein
MNPVQPMTPAGFDLDLLLVLDRGAERRSVGGRSS